MTRLLAFLAVILSTGRMCVQAGPLCFNGDLTGPQTQSISRADERIEKLSQLTDEHLTNETIELLYGPPIVELNERQIRQAKEVYGGLFTERVVEPVTVTPVVLPTSGCRDERRVYTRGGVNVVHTTRVCSPVHSSVSYRSQTYGGRPVGTGTRTTRYQTVHTVPVQQHQTVYRTTGRTISRWTREARPHRRRVEVQLCSDPAVVRQSINFARDTEGNLVQVAELDDQYQSIVNEPECPLELPVATDANIICKRKWVDVPAVVIPLKGRRGYIQLRDIRVPRCFAHVVLEN